MPLREVLRDDLRRAMKERDTAAVSALRSALAAIANAEAVAVPEHDPTAEPLGTAGLARDVPRRVLGADEVVAIVRDDVDARRAALPSYERHGDPARVERMRAELRVLSRYVDADDTTA